ncbi:siderophore-interacting protein [Streptomyces sp. 549]|uniref:siderophore-interacting protein n=1 Tax=Streptomyces sp. 549 TaxID=3049076 RepID=UPI0024C22C8F|nr:siderophore-interacting protein [Streptomyces sp. 549]MDK1475626.1 siderophore-interacting protein [Streptomyces sp. 549]
MSTSAAVPATDAFSFFEVRVSRVRRLGPSLTRITFGGEQLRDFASGGRDQSFSLFLPHPGQQVPVLPLDAGGEWFARWRAVPEDERAVMRSYTVRAQRTSPPEVDVDFALHGDLGPASRWAAGASPGDRAVLLGPAVADNRSVAFRPPPEADWLLLAADETALPAVGGILDWLPQGSRAHVWITVPEEADRQELPLGPGMHVTWLTHHGDSRRGGRDLLDAVRAAALPAGAPYAWLAGEAGAVRALRRHLVGDRGFDRRTVTFTGYWRLGSSEEQLRAEAMAEAAGTGTAGQDAGPATA